MHRASALLTGALLCLGKFGTLALQAQESQEKTPTESEPVPATRHICNVGGSLETWGSSEYGYPYANRVLALSLDGRWLAFPFVESADVVKTPTEEAGAITGDWWVNLCDLTAPPGSECPRWRQGSLDMHSPVVAGPHNTVAFLADDPSRRFVHEQLARLWALENKKREDATENPAYKGTNIFDQEGEDTEKLPPEYIRVCWCGTGKSAYYRLPMASLEEPRPRSRSRLLDLWFADNPVTKKPSLFALLFNGTLCIWALKDEGRPPKVNMLLVEDQPNATNVYDLVAAATKTRRARQDDEFVHGLFAVAHASNRIALCNPEKPPVRVIFITSGKVRTLDIPKDLRDAPYRDLLLSENGRYCAAFRPTKRAGYLKIEKPVIISTPLPDYPNVMEVWNAETGKFLWQHTLRDRFFVSRAAFSPDGTRLVTWSCVGHDLERELRQPAGTVSDEERQKQQEELYKAGVLQLWDAATGKPSGTLPFPVKLWIQALAFTPDGKQVAILVHGGACHFIETTVFTSPK